MRTVREADYPGTNPAVAANRTIWRRSAGRRDAGTHLRRFIRRT